MFEIDNRFTLDGSSRRRGARQGPPAGDQTDRAGRGDHLRLRTRVLRSLSTGSRVQMPEVSGSAKNAVTRNYAEGDKSKFMSRGASAAVPDALRVLALHERKSSIRLLHARLTA